MKCPKCGAEIDAARLLGKSGGKAGKGASKARTSEQARKAAEARWEKHRGKEQNDKEWHEGRKEPHADTNNEK